MDHECTCQAPPSDWTDYHSQTYGLHHREGCPLRMTQEEYFGVDGEVILKQSDIQIGFQIVGTES